MECVDIYKEKNESIYLSCTKHTTQSQCKLDQRTYYGILKLLRETYKEDSSRYRQGQRLSAKN